ncbi:MAG: hypothetical protein HRU76_13500 [Phycisphaeraceae bacterium]|nr:MAG: hypothetical protein HRU76_13500 [Phycisphaeraceae bacterium]
MSKDDENPALRLAHALAEVYLAAREWSVACHHLAVPDSPYTIEERLEARASAVAALQECIRLAKAAIPGADEWIRPILGTPPGKYTSRIKTILHRLASALVVYGHGLPPEGEHRAAWQKDVDATHKVQLELKGLDYSALPAEGTRKPPEPKVELNESERSIVAALRKHGARLTTDPLLKKALGIANANGKATLASLVRRGILDNRGDVKPRGYGLCEWAEHGHDRGHD